MDKRTSNKVTMYEGLLTVLNENTDKVSTIDGFADAVDKVLSDGKSNMRIKTWKHPNQ